MSPKPTNPLVSVVLWSGYQISRHRSLALLISVLMLTVGGALVGAAWGVALLMVLLGAGIPAAEIFWDGRTESRDDVALARERILESALAQLLESTATATTWSRAQRQAAATGAARVVAHDLAGAFASVPDVRVVVFTVGNDGLSMTPIATAGRATRPGDFQRGTPRGDNAFRVLNEERGRFVIEYDVTNSPPDRWAGTAVGYDTFISAPIRSSEDGFGLLTIDASVAGSLDLQHGATVALFASALAVVFAEAARGGSSAT